MAEIGKKLFKPKEENVSKQDSFRYGKNDILEEVFEVLKRTELHYIKSSVLDIYFPLEIKMKLQKVIKVYSLPLRITFLISQNL